MAQPLGYSYGCAWADNTTYLSSSVYGIYASPQDQSRLPIPDNHYQPQMEYSTERYGTPVHEQNNLYQSTPTYDSSQTTNSSPTYYSTFYTPNSSWSSSSHSASGYSSPELNTPPSCCQNTSSYLDHHGDDETEDAMLTLERRFIPVINSQKPVSTWASQLYEYYRNEIQKIALDVDWSNAACGQQKDLISENKTKKNELLERVNRSLKVLEEYKLSGKSTPQGRKARLTRRPPKHLNPTAQKLLKEWYRDHEDNPYPDADTVDLLAHEGKVTAEQVKKWFCNKRARSANTRKLSDIVKLRQKQREEMLAACE